MVWGCKASNEVRIPFMSTFNLCNRSVTIHVLVLHQNYNPSPFIPKIGLCPVLGLGIIVIPIYAQMIYTFLQYPSFEAVKNYFYFLIHRWAFMPLTNSDGERIYVRLESEDSWDQALESTTGKMTLQATYTDTWIEARKIVIKIILHFMAIYCVY